MTPEQLETSKRLDEFTSRNNLVRVRTGDTDFGILQKIGGLKHTPWRGDRDFSRLFDHTNVWRREYDRTPILLTTEPYIALCRAESRLLDDLCLLYGLDYEIGWEAIWNPPWTLMIKLFRAGTKWRPDDVAAA